MSDAEREATWRAGFLAGAAAEWRGSAEVVRLVLAAQAAGGRLVLLAALDAMGIDDLALGDGEGSGAVQPQDAGQAWADHLAGRQPTPLPRLPGMD